MKIRNRLLLTYLTLLLAVILLLGLFLQSSLNEFFLVDLEKTLQKDAGVFASLINSEEDWQSDYTKAQVDRFAELFDARITLISNGGEVWADSAYDATRMNNHATRPEVVQALQGRIGTSSRHSATLEMDTLYLAYPVFAEEGVRGVIRISKSMTVVEEIISALERIILSGILIALFIGALISYFLAKTITNPIKEISQTADEIAGGNLEKRIFLNRRDEMGRLAWAINKMTEKLKEEIRTVRNRSQRLETILQNMVSGVLVISENGLVEGINPEAEKIFEISWEKIKHKPYQTFLRNYDFQESFDRILREGLRSELEFTIYYPQEKNVKAFFAPIYGEERVEQVVIVFHDVSRLKKLEKIKSDFVANASHELRTPLTAIKGFSETLLEGALQDENVSRRFVDIIDKEADRLIHLVNTLLDLSRLEQGKKDVFKPESLFLGEILEYCYQSMQNKAKESGIILKLEIPNPEKTVLADRNLLTQAVFNLVDNALKHSGNNGDVFLRVRYTEKEVLLEVEDKGKGIPPQETERIFERFYQVQHERPGDRKGTGLGLSIVKHIALLHEGTVEVESEVGRGSIFRIRLPNSR